MNLVALIEALRIVLLSSWVLLTLMITAVAPLTSAVLTPNPRFGAYSTPSKSQIAPSLSKTSSSVPWGSLSTSARTFCCPFALILHRSLDEPSTTLISIELHNSMISEQSSSLSTKTSLISTPSLRALRTSSSPVI